MKFLTLISAALISGAVLRLSFPPLGFGLLVFIALTPVMLVLQSYGSSDGFYAGMIVGCFLYADSMGAFVSWSPYLVILPTAMASLIFGLLFCATKWMSTRLPGHISWVALPICWIPLSVFCEQVLLLPLSFSMPLALNFGFLLTPIRFIGDTGMDALVLSVSSAIAALLQGKLNPSGLAMWLLTICLSALGAYWTTKTDIRTAKNAVRVSLLQPAHSVEQERRSRWSLGARRSRENSLDVLTLRAIEASGEVILWPEGGNGLFNARLTNRRNILKDMSLKSGAVILATGMDLTPDGEHYNVVHHIQEGKFVKDARKSKLVRFSEAHLKMGEPTVFQTRYGAIGISICYESVFSDHVISLRDQGAQAIFVTSNDSSFGLAATPYWHAAYSVLKGIEAGLPVVFLSNNGPALASDQLGVVTEYDSYSSTPIAHNWNVRMVTANQFNSARLSWFLLALPLMGVYFLLLNK